MKCNSNNDGLHLKIKQTNQIIFLNLNSFFKDSNQIRLPICAFQAALSPLKCYNYKISSSGIKFGSSVWGYDKLKITRGPHLVQFLGPGKNCTSWVVHRLNSTSTNLLITNSTITNFMPIHTAYSWNIMCHKSEGNCGLWVLNEIT